MGPRTSDTSSSISVLSTPRPTPTLNARPTPTLNASNPSFAALTSSAVCLARRAAARAQRWRPARALRSSWRFLSSRWTDFALATSQRDRTRREDRHYDVLQRPGQRPVLRCEAFAGESACGASIAKRKGAIVAHKRPSASDVVSPAPITDPQPKPAWATLTRAEAHALRRSAPLTPVRLAEPGVNPRRHV